MLEVKICCVLRTVICAVDAVNELVRRPKDEIVLGKEVRTFPNPATVDTSCDVEI